MLLIPHFLFLLAVREIQDAKEGNENNSNNNNNLTDSSDEVIVLDDFVPSHNRDTMLPGNSAVPPIFK